MKSHSEVIIITSELEASQVIGPFKDNGAEKWLQNAGAKKSYHNHVPDNIWILGRYCCEITKLKGANDV